MKGEDKPTCAFSPMSERLPQIESESESERIIFQGGRRQID